MLYGFLWVPRKPYRIVFSRAPVALVPMASLSRALSEFRKGRTMVVHMSAADEEEIFAEMLPLFVDDAKDKITRLEELIDIFSVKFDRSDLLMEFMRTIHSLKGSSGSMGFPTISVICHKLEGYMAKTTIFDRRVADDVQVYLARISDILDVRKNPRDTESQGILRSLPSPIDVIVVGTKKLIQALFIGPKNIQFTIIEAELRACGCNVTLATTSFLGIELAVRMRPDLIMVSNVIDAVSGIEMAAILKTIQRTRAIAVMLVKSDFDDPGKAEEIRRALPPRVEIVRKGKRFQEDFAAALVKLKVL
ncbi:putative HPt domain-containing protein [uncultured Gammaproteobacteria bacterium]